VTDCATTHIANGKFFPKPSELKPERTAGEKSKFPALYSEQWWEARSKLLAEAFPRGLSEISRKRLDEATIGLSPSPVLEEQASRCYQRAWPELSHAMDPFA
jgi:hypothetical protein